MLEDRILSHQGVKRRQRPFSRELAEMVGSAVGYNTRAFVTFGEPIADSAAGIIIRVATCSSSRTSCAAGSARLQKVLPTHARRRGDEAVDDGRPISKGAWPAR